MHLKRKKNDRHTIFLIIGFVSIVFLVLVCVFLVSENLSTVDDSLDMLSQTGTVKNNAMDQVLLKEVKKEVGHHISAMRNVLFISFGVLVTFSGVIIYDAYLNRKNKNELINEKDRAETLAGAKRAFIANMSHEMKTPLHAMYGVAQELTKDAYILENHLGLINKLQKSSQHLLNMVEDLLMVSNDGEMVTSFQDSSFNLEMTIQEVTEEYRKKAKQKGLEFYLRSHVTGSKILKGDSRKLQHVISHLLDNSLKFTQEGKIELSYWLKEKNYHEGMLYLQINDTGVGIPEEKLQVIFKELEQGDNSDTKQYPGIGVGLAITKKLVMSQGGSISVSSEEGAYTKFTVSIPYKFDTSSISLEVGKSIMDQPSVLVVDDDEFNLLLATSMLKNKNCKVLTATEGQEASALLRDNDFDIILLDIHLPKVSGVVVAESLRKSQSKNSKTPILAVTATLLNETAVDRFRTVGINDWLPKPYNEAQLWEKINSLIAADGNKRV